MSWPYSSSIPHIEGSPKELELFSLPPVQSAVMKTQYIDYRPVSNISQNAPIEFHIPGQSPEYTDLQHSRLYIKAKIVKGDGTSTLVTTEVAPINFLHSTLFEQIDIRVNGVLVSSADGNYAYKTYIQTLLSATKDKVESQLQNALFYTETNVFDTDPVGGSNPGYAARFTRTKGSKSFEMCYYLLQDFLQCEKYLLNGCDIDITLYPNRPIFYLKSTEAKPDFQIVIEDIIFQALRINLNPAALIGIQNKLEESPALYNYTTYANLFHAQGKWYNDSGLIISLEKFTDGYALYCFNLENLFPEEQYLNLLKTGNIRLEAVFDTALNTPYTIIAYAEFEKIVQIDKTRTVSFM
ncbi:hypothetical protein KUTeg_022271 [Tegillarca granosa]|uniref:Uncharacterized protein n=1 Tax=Tegillarca granosa TaxID=220873 RepID=A0ABQ9EA45_TEGGR|nr:hypothetical protein KUTeg_022271 [Tegillarca granosa]